MADAGDQTNSPDVQGDVAPAKTENENVAPRSSCTDSQTQSAPSSPAHGVKAKIDVLLKAAGDAPIMKKKKWSVERTKSVGWIIEFIRRFLKLETADCLFLYVNQAFAPSPDVEVGKLYDCFESDGKLIMHYCRSQAWG